MHLMNKPADAGDICRVIAADRMTSTRPPALNQSSK
jgi:hypothetical protein